MKRKIGKILIANRGEIACRIIKTCKKLGIKTVVIFNELERGLPHTSAGDDCVSLGHGSLAETYLNSEKIVKIAKEKEVDAIHPGYGFLSENADFCAEVNSAGIIFIGPSADVINLMGDKIGSKKAMEKIGVPLIPGFHGSDQSEETLLKESIKIGYPVLIKASAGGGGKGMRIVKKESDFLESLKMVQSEAKKSFGSSKVLIEKYIESPRHIEVQVISDNFGNHLHLFERECSIQRRYQKIIEEAPSPSISPATRKKICDAAVNITKNIDYTGAGTVEFVMDQNEAFYFLEMNTRLQVEHPVTECITGMDLVELQIVVAENRSLDIRQDDIDIEGHSIECRVYAEDPDFNYRPSIGKIEKIGGSKNKFIRIDSGVADGNVVGTEFDPMLSKLIAFGKDREECLKHLNQCLDDFRFNGLKTNNRFLKRIINDEIFIRGKYTTKYLEERKELIKEDVEIAPFIAKLLFDDKRKNESKLKKLSGFRN